MNGVLIAVANDTNTKTTAAYLPPFALPALVAIAAISIGMIADAADAKPLATRNE